VPGASVRRARALRAWLSTTMRLWKPSTTMGDDQDGATSQAAARRAPVTSLMSPRTATGPAIMTTPTTAARTVRRVTTATPATMALAARRVTMTHPATARRARRMAAASPPATTLRATGRAAATSPATAGRTAAALRPANRVVAEARAQVRVGRQLPTRILLFTTDTRQPLSDCADGRFRGASSVVGPATGLRRTMDGRRILG
jgi:hypothetical protein